MRNYPKGITISNKGLIEWTATKASQIKSHTLGEYNNFPFG